MDRIDEGIDQSDGNGLGADLGNGAGDALDVAGVERALDAAVATDALGNPEPAVPRHQRGLTLGAQAVDVAPSVPADLQHVLEPLGGDENTRRQPPLLTIAITSSMAAMS